jgi:hypothetical protein
MDTLSILFWIKKARVLQKNLKDAIAIVIHVTLKLLNWIILKRYHFSHVKSTSNSDHYAEISQIIHLLEVKSLFLYTCGVTN